MGRRRPIGVTLIFTGQDRKNADRLISLVYYFYKEPKAFTGGVLRLLRLYPGIDYASDEQVIDIVPAQDMAVAFSSWMSHEVMRVSEEIERLAVSHASAAEVALMARSQGMVPLRDDGWRKVVMGQTSIEEILRVVA